MKIITAEVTEITNLTDSIIQLMLRPEEAISYHAGQYLQIHFGAELLYYSIANAPVPDKTIELHMRCLPDNPLHQRLRAKIKQDYKLEISLPYGDCHVDNLLADEPVIFLAAGTGFVPVKAMIEALAGQGDPRKIMLYRAVRPEDELYLKVGNVANVMITDDYNNLVKKLIAEKSGSLAQCQIVISGSRDFVFYSRDLLLTHGATGSKIFSDAFNI